MTGPCPAGTDSVVRVTAILLSVSSASLGISTVTPKDVVTVPPSGPTETADGTGVFPPPDEHAATNKTVRIDARLFIGTSFR